MRSDETPRAPVRTAVVGVGLMGVLFARLLEQSARGRLIALAEADASRHSALEKDFGVPVYTDCYQLLDSTKPDAAVIATSDQAHLEPATAVLERGIPLLIEKPLALTVADAERIVRTAAATKTLLMVAQVLRFDPRFALLRDAVTRGELGEVQLVHGRREAPLAEGTRLAGRTSLAFYVGVHDIDAIHWITQARVCQVMASYSGCVPGLPDTEAVLTATLWLDNGAAATLQHSWTLPDSTYRIHTQLFEVIGTRGTGRVDALDDGLRLETGGRVTNPSVHYVFSPILQGRICGVYRDELEHFLECLQTGREPVVTGADGAAAVAVASEIDEAARTGRRCEVHYERRE
jgi:predicted dehydrogenase